MSLLSSPSSSRLPHPPQISPNTVLMNSSGPQDGFTGIPHISDDIENLAIQADMQRRTSPLAMKKGKGRVEGLFYPMTYIRGEWMEGLLTRNVGKKRVKYLLSDEVLCLGSSEAPITSEFSRPLIFLEAYKHGCPPSSAQVYMSESQITWLVDELYARVGGTGEKIKLKDVDVDSGKAVKMDEFEATRKVTFRNDVARFRSRCGLPLTIPATQKKKKEPSPAQSAAPARPSSSTTPSAVLQPAVPKTSTSPGSSTPIAFGPPRPPHLLPAKPTSFASLTKSERSARLQAAREEALQHHIAVQKASLPRARQFYRNLERLGGAALACDVESWTEDADVLLELGMAWFIWSEGEDGDMVRDSGSKHYIIKETTQYQNEEIEAKREDYSLGISETLPQAEVAARLKMKIAELSSYGPLVLVFHDASAETRYFQKLGIDPTAYLTSIPSQFSSPTIQAWPSLPAAFAGTITSPILISDTQNLYCGWSDPPVKQINLGKACKALGLDVQIEKLHNAGNDAFATLRMWVLLLDPGSSDARTSKAPKREDGSDVLSAASQDIASLSDGSATAQQSHVQPADLLGASDVEHKAVSPTSQDTSLVKLMQRHCAVGNLIDL